jgi:hypothetical protein
MAINVSFNGSTIYKPGSYSKEEIDLGGGFPLSPTGIIGIFGESSAGTPGANEPNISNNVFSPDQFPSIRAKYGSGPIVDACNFLFAPGADGAIPGGAQAVYIYKTNASVRASLTLSGYSSAIVKANEYGVGGNRITLKITGSGSTRTMTLSQKRDSLVVSQTLGGNSVITVTNASVGSTVSIDASNVILFDGTLTTTLAKSSYATVADLIADIAIIAGWSLSVVSTGADPRLPLSVLDQVTSLSAVGGASVKKDAYEVQQFFAQSNIASLSGGPSIGLPTALLETSLSGGALGGSSSAEIVNGLAKFEKLRLNSIVPLFSRDSSADVTDGITDSSSSYTIDGIHQAVKTHCSLMASTKKKSERQGYLSCKDSYVNCKAKALNIADARQQLIIQDIKQNDSQGNLKWFMPWAGAALLAGARGGSPVGNPMTFKYFNMSGIRQTGQSMSTAEVNIINDFDPDTQYDDGIINGISFFDHPQTGGFRMVLDNTTYGKDGNWVYNRAHVLYAADIIAFDFRSQLENIYVGLKNNVAASAIKSTCDSILSTYLAQGITVRTSDAANGYKQLVVQINGNTVNISVVVKLVEGIDFVLADITLQRATATA